MCISKPTFLKFSFLALIFPFSLENSLACMYGPPYRTVCETYAQADAVIIGKIESVKGNRSNQNGGIRVERTFKGPNRKEIVLSQPQSTCDWDFSGEVGESLLLYLVRNKSTKKYSAIGVGLD